ncbi:unnamed protein product [Dicrocoelium dendriticum]|nr:unnamed protein product [Dicrocoelium dendriticum]
MIDMHTFKYNSSRVPNGKLLGIPVGKRSMVKQTAKGVDAKILKKQLCIQKDKEKLKNLVDRLRTLGERSTFHGVDVLLESRPGWPRQLVWVIVSIMIH